jgi:hypothetical protein
MHVYAHQESSKGMHPSGVYRSRCSCSSLTTPTRILRCTTFLTVAHAYCCTSLVVGSWLPSEAAVTDVETSCPLRQCPLIMMGYCHSPVVISYNPPLLLRNHRAFQILNEPLQIDSSEGTTPPHTQVRTLEHRRSRHDAGQKGISSARSVGIGVAIRRDIGALRRLEELIDIGTAQLHIAAHIREVVAAELVDEGNVNVHLPTVVEVDVLDGKIAATCPAIGLLHGRDIVTLCGQACVMTDLLQRIQAKIVP